MGKTLEQISVTGTIPHVGIANVLERKTQEQDQQVVCIFEVPSEEEIPEDAKPEDRPDPVKMYQFPLPDAAAEAMAKAILAQLEMKRRQASGIWTPGPEVPAEVAAAAAATRTDRPVTAPRQPMPEPPAQPTEQQSRKADAVRIPGQ